MRSFKIIFPSSAYNMSNRFIVHPCQEVIPIILLEIWHSHGHDIGSSPCGFTLRFSDFIKFFFAFIDMA